MNAWDSVLFIPFYLWVLPGMGFLAQYSFLAILGSSVKVENLPGGPSGPSGVGGVRCSAMRCVKGGFLLGGCLWRGNRLSGFGMLAAWFNRGGVVPGGDRVVHMKGLLCGKRLCVVGGHRALGWLPGSVRGRLCEVGGHCAL